MSSSDPMNYDYCKNQQELELGATTFLMVALWKIILDLATNVTNNYIILYSSNMRISSRNS